MSRFKVNLLFVFSILCSIFFCVNVQAQTESTTTMTTVQSPQENTVTTTTLKPGKDGTTTKVVETRRTIVTTVPSPNEVIATPEGYVSCTTVPAAWRGEVWIPAHKACKYENSTHGAAWVEGYWKCNKATVSGVCTIWEWQEGHWEKTFSY